MFEGLNVHQLPARVACRYANRYDESGARTQLLLDPGEPLDAAEIETVAGAADALLLAPAFHELSGVPASGPRLRAVSLQGALRAVDGERVIAHPDPLAQARTLVGGGTWAFFSVEDAAEPEGLARQLAKAGARVWLTRAHVGATLFDGASERSFSAIPSDVLVDPTGAGDCFAAAFVVRFLETEDLGEATRFALAAGSLAVEHVGIAGIPARAAIERRLEREAA